MVIVLLRGDHRLNEIKLRNALGADFRQASAEEIEAELGPVGFIGPVGAGVPVIKDAAIDGDSYVTGANKPDTHLRGVEPGRDFDFEELDVRTVEAGDTAPGGGAIEIEPAIEVGNIFKLGTRYSEPLGATYLDEERDRAADRDGQLRDRPGADRRRRDRAGRRREAGSSGRAAIAPWQVHLVSLAKAGEAEREAADRLYEELRAAGRRGPLRRPRRRAGGEADRRRAARLPAAARRRPPRPRRRRGRGDRARRRRRARAAAGGGRRAGAGAARRACDG